MTIPLRLLGISAILAMSASAIVAAECVAMADPGSDWDFSCREVGKILHDIGQVDTPVQVTNRSGEGAAFANTMNTLGEGHDLIVAASEVTVLRLAQGAYPVLTADQVRFVGAIGADPGVIVVTAESPFRSLSDMVDAVRADPSGVVFSGGSEAGGADHLKVLKLLQAAEFTDATKLRYIGAESDADAITLAVSGFTQAMAGSLSEIKGFLATGDVRALAVLTEERVPGFEDIPSAKEQGFDVTAVDWHGFYMPKATSDEEFNAWSAKLLAVADSDAWKEVMAANGLVPFTKVGLEFQSWVDDAISDATELLKVIGALR